MKKLDSVDIDFIADTYGRPEWSIELIAEKLDRNVNTVWSAATRMGLERPEQTAYTVRINYEMIWREIASGSSIKNCSEKMGISIQSIRYAIKKMKKMTESQRIATWNRYRISKGLTLITHA